MKTVREFLNERRRKTGERRVEAWLAGRGICELQGDGSIANQAGAAFRSDLNNELQAIIRGQDGTTAPATTYAYQIWNDTTNGLRKQRNAANSGWIIRGELAETRTFDRASNTILGLGDFGCFFRGTASFTQTLTAAATLGDGWRCFYRVESGATIVLDPNGAENIDGAATKSVIGPASGIIYCNGSAFYTVGFSAGATLSSASLVGGVVPYVGMINGTIVASRAGSAETIAIKTLAGADPSSGDPVTFVFRNVTAGTGDYVFLQATAALSVTISSGSTMGATNSVPFRIWLTVFNDAGTLRLGVVNCLSGLSILSLRDDEVRSSTAEGGAGAADSAQVIYTGTAVTSKAARLLGYLEYTLATVGTWGTAPSKIQLFGPGVSMPGEVVQEPFNEVNTLASGATTTPYDNTIPQNTEGDQYMTQAITPKFAGNLLEIECNPMLSCNGADNIAVAIFQDSTANAIASGSCTTGASFAMSPLIRHRMLAGTASATTFKMRAGKAGAGNVALNGNASGGPSQLYGGVAASSMKVKEIMV